MTSVKFTLIMEIGGNMEKNNPLYKGQGIHVITAIFTIEQGIAKDC